MARASVTRRRRRGRRRDRTLLLVALCGLALWIVVEAWRWPEVAALAQERPGTTAFIERFRARQRAVGRDDRVARVWTRYAAISPHLKRAVLVAEDINFFSHGGFDLGEVKQALSEAIEELEAPRGASTITQQLAKNLWLSPSRSPLRKLREIILTWQLERRLAKRRILELYLNVVEFGPGIYGAEAASRRYFRKSAADLGETEAAELAASLPNPGAWHPGSRRHGYQRHVERILQRMARAEFLWTQI